jgi:hypothetical protein
VSHLPSIKPYHPNILISFLFSSFLMILLSFGPLRANIVINELMHDPDGTDTGYEWIELYNNVQPTSIWKRPHLESRINVLGSLCLPAFYPQGGTLSAAGRGIGTKRQFTADLVFQNGGSETDAVRFKARTEPIPIPCFMTLPII